MLRACCPSPRGRRGHLGTWSGASPKVTTPSLPRLRRTRPARRLVTAPRHRRLSSPYYGPRHDPSGRSSTHPAPMCSRWAKAWSRSRHHQPLSETGWMLVGDRFMCEGSRGLPVSAPASQLPSTPTSRPQVTREVAHPSGRMLVDKFEHRIAPWAVGFQERRDAIGRHCHHQPSAAEYCLFSSGSCDTGSLGSRRSPKPHLRRPPLGTHPVAECLL